MPILQLEPTVGIGVGLAVAGVVLTVLGGIHLWVAVAPFRARQLTVAELPNNPGPARVQGVARDYSGTVTGPISGRECLICEWAVEEEGATDQTLASGLRGGPFRLEDDTGGCLVEPAGSTRSFEADSVTVPAGMHLPAELLQFLDRLPEVETYDPEARQRFVERRLDPGEDCTVHGEVQYELLRDGEAGDVNARLVEGSLRRFAIRDNHERPTVRSKLKPAFLYLAVAAVLFVGVGLLLL